MDVSVETVCNSLVRSRLLPPSTIRQLHQRWKTEAGPAAGDSARFGKWLVAGGHVTDFQWALIVRGKVDNFYLNDYKLVDRLGQGRMVGIYRAVHQLGQTVAIKVLPPSRVKDEESFGRFKREARLAVKLKHPNVVRTYQMGLSNGLHYIVMEYLDGETLEEVLQRRKQLPPSEAARIVHQALLGLQHIHQMGMVHRDLKPVNLMLVPGAPKGGPDTTANATVKVLDIGLGRAMFDENAPGQPDAPDLTGAGALLGTPEYLAPEQARNAHTADIRADIYSLGCVLYHCLAGRPPFQEVNAVLLMVKHATEKPRPLKELNPAVPDGLQQIVDWMVAKDPSQRYPTPERAAQALQVFLAAGEGPRVAEVEPQMQAYLKWLEINGTGDGGPLTPMPVLADSPAAAAPLIPPPAAPVRATPVPTPVVGSPALQRVPAPMPVAIAEPEASPMLSPEPMVFTAVPMPPQAPAPRRAFGGRELLLIGIGLGLGLGMVGLMGTLIWLLIRKLF